MSSLFELYSQHAALSLEKQLALGEVIGDHSFSFDTNSGTMSFGDELAFPMQILGSVSRQSNSWLWAWANSSPMPEALLQAAHQLQELGEEWGIEELAEPDFAIVELPVPGSILSIHQMLHPGSEPNASLDGHLLAMVAAGICQADAYYGADYGQGIAYVLMPSVPEAAAHRSDEPAQMAAIFSRVLQMPYELDQRAAFIAYLEQKGYTVETETSAAQLRGVKGNKSLTATFDDDDLLTTLQTS